jgi:hypothetical protein
MPQQLIFLPMGALAFLTFAVLLVIPFRRFAAGRAGQVRAADFAFGESQQVPDHVTIPNRAYMNLLELPVLFYVAGVMYFVTAKVDVLVLAIAWIYVTLRFVHSAIHMTYNNVMHRLIPFAASNVVLLAFWILFFVKLGAPA